MAFSAVILGTVVAIAGFLTLTTIMATGPLAALGFAVLGGQTTAAMFVAKAMVCRSLRRKRIDG
jgi:hypothetical protein